VAHFLEHLVFKGTKKYPNRLKLAIKLDSVGASSNAFTSKEYTGFYVTTASQHLPLGLDVLQQLVFQPLLRKADVIHERAVIKEEIRMHQDSPDDYIAQEYERMAYQGTGLEHPISGSLETVSQVEAKDLTEFLDQWYGLGNIVLVLAGDADYLQHSDCKEIVEQVFAQQPACREDHYQERIEQFLDTEPYSQERLFVADKKTAQAHFALGWPALKRNDPQRYVLSVLSTVIGGNRSSRLFNVVREQKGLAYYVYSDIDQYHDGGMLGASAGVNIDKVEEGIAATLEQYQQLASGEQPVTEAELKKAKDYLTGRILLGLEDSRSVAHYYGLKRILLDKIEDPDQVVEQIQAVTAKQVQQLAAKIIRPGQVKLAVVGPFSNDQRFHQLLD
jgi:predicted Zn-dependent peptidase